LLAAPPYEAVENFVPGRFFPSSSPLVFDTNFLDLLFEVVPPPRKEAIVKGHF